MMDEFLLEAFHATAYDVSVDVVTWATIRIDLPLPTELHAVVGAAHWGFITAWNPQAKRRPNAENRIAQQALVAALEALPGARVFAAIGVGNAGWAEPSLFVTGVDVAALDALAREHAQLAYVRGTGAGAAQLRVLG